MPIRFAALLWTCAAIAQGATPQYTINTFAGTDFSGDGRSALAATLIQPQGLAVDRSGALYFSDAGDHRIRKVSGGIIRTVAGTGVPGLRGDGGPAAQAQFRSPYGLAFDAYGNLYVADLGNARVRRIAPDGAILTVAGGGDVVPDAKTPIAGTQARLVQPRDLAVDRTGHLFISDFGAHRVYQLTPGGMLSVVAGTGQPGAIREPVPALEAPLAYPAGLAIDDLGNLYIADSGNRRVRRFAGGWLSTLTDSKGAPLEFATPTGLALDPAQRLYIADGGGRVTVLTPQGEVSSWGIGGSAVAIGPMAEIYGTSGRQIQRLVAGVIEPVAGVATGAGAGDGRPSSEWRFHTPSSIVRDVSGSIYIADTGHGRVRRITPAGGLTTVTTQVQAPVALALDSASRLHIADRATGNIYRLRPNGAVEVFAQGSDNRPFQPGAIAFDSRDQLYLADTGNHLIRRVNADGTLTLVAGGGRDDADGPALLARLNAPAGLAFDASGTLWFTEAGSGRLRKLTASGSIETVRDLELKEPRGLRVTGDGYLLVADSGTHRVLRITPDGAWIPIAGSGDRGFAGDGGPALAAMLHTPSDLLIEPSGSILIADSGNHRIRRLSPVQTGPVTPEGPPPPAVTLPSFAVQHAATRREQPVAPGQLAILAGDGLEGENLKVSFAGLAATVLQRAPRSVTVQVPAGVPLGMVEVTVTTASASSSAPAEIVAAAPGLLADSSGQAAALNEDGWPNSPGNPAGRGSVLALFLTGQGAGEPAIEAHISGYPCEVIWSGAAPGLPGIWQVNIRTPSGFAPGGVQPVILTVNGVRTQNGVTVVTR